MLCIQPDPKRSTLASSLARNRRCHRRFGFWLISWLLFLCVPVYGIDRDQKLAERYHTAWTFKDGAPAEIYALAQTTDGFLWLGTAPGCPVSMEFNFNPTNRNLGKPFRNAMWSLDSPYQMEAYGSATGTAASASSRMGQ